MDVRVSRTEVNGPWQPRLVGSYFAARGLCGVSVNEGLLRYHDAKTGPIAQEFVDAVWGVGVLRADVFAFDWRARQYAVTDNIPNCEQYGLAPAEPVVVVLDPMDCSYEPWAALHQFEAILDMPSAWDSLQENLFRRWLVANDLSGIDINHCAGATVPGFLGGEVAADNFAHDQTVIYLSFVAQLWQQFRAMTPGQRLKGVRPAQ